MNTVKRAYKTTTTPPSLRRVYALPRKAALTHCIPAAPFFYFFTILHSHTNTRTLTLHP